MDTDFQEMADNREPKFISQEMLHDLARDLDLPKEKVKSLDLVSRNGICYKKEFSSPRFVVDHKELSSFFKMEHKLSQELKKDRTAAKRRFTRKVNIFKEAHGAATSGEVLRHMYEKVDESFKVVDAANEEVIALLKESEPCDEHERYITDLEIVKHEVYSILVADAGKVKQKPTLAIKKLEPPKFCGSIRAFPTFLKDYERLVVSQQGMDL
ncbi:hypothetical protein GWK47_052867 [Chionoecetes opilio]|uniref:Uncharacterized protein n=1 Tax=Chionoecetes opilio TaxID=41210 RepID=A0A8J4Y1D9_CHIOP|nr:hypothetical protein GWK47_052867 [Chionoecetes opilio]